jgi:hypothetical protein
MAVLVRFEDSAQQRVYMPQYILLHLHTARDVAMPDPFG